MAAVESRTPAVAVKPSPSGAVFHTRPTRGRPPRRLFRPVWRGASSDHDLGHPASVVTIDAYQNLSTPFDGPNVERGRPACPPDGSPMGSASPRRRYTTPLFGRPHYSPDEYKALIRPNVADSVGTAPSPGPCTYPCVKTPSGPAIGKYRNACDELTASGCSQTTPCPTGRESC